MGMTLLILLALFYLGGILAEPRSPAIRAGHHWLCVTAAIVLALLLTEGFVAWGWN
jgi:hypothetical protein